MTESTDEPVPANAPKRDDDDKRERPEVFRNDDSDLPMGETTEATPPPETDTDDLAEGSDNDDGDDDETVPQ
jgi:hypothetical protein